MDCEGVPVSDDSISFAQCCFGLSAVSFALPGQCSLCPTPSASKFIIYLISSAMPCIYDQVHYYWLGLQRIDSYVYMRDLCIFGCPTYID